MDFGQRERSIAMADMAIKTDKLSFSIGERTILKKVSIEITKHHFVGLLGPNGSGKTTFIKHLYRELEPKKNVVWINGKDIDGYEQRELARTLTVMKQENNSDFEYTVYQMTLMGRAPYRLSYESYREDDKELADKYLKSVGMYEKKDQLFSTLSGGEKQRVLIARALTQEVGILLLDEPTNHLDIFYQMYLTETIKNLNRTVVSVFHDMNLAATFCDYLYVLRGGEIFSQGKAEDILTVKMLAEVFDMEADIIDNKGKPHIIYQHAMPETFFKDR